MKRKFEDDFGVVGEMMEFGTLMPVMEGRRSDYARLKDLKAKKLHDMMVELHVHHQRVYVMWVLEYGSKDEKRAALDGK